jgi:hypothetical protein
VIDREFRPKFTFVLFPGTRNRVPRSNAACCPLLGNCVLGRRYFVRQAGDSSGVREIHQGPKALWGLKCPKHPYSW